MKITSSWIIAFGFLSRLLVAAWNGFIGPSIGGDMDALGFQDAAYQIATFGRYEDFHVGTAPYINALGFIYGLTIPHLFIGSLISCLFWLASAWVLRASFLLIPSAINEIRLALWIYAFLPSSLFLTAVTMREVYQMFFINLAVFSMLKVWSERNHSYALVMLFAVGTAGLFHGALLAFALVFCPSALFFLYGGLNKKLPILAIGLVVACSLAVVWYGFLILGELSYNIADGLDEAVATYQSGGLNAFGRAFYKIEAINTGLPFFFIGVPVGFFQYLFEPMPWRNLLSVDVPVIIENILRAFLIYRALVILAGKAESSKVLRYQFIYFYIVLELIWSIGTVNWGTAIRHHLPATGLLLLAAFSVKATENGNGFYLFGRRLRWG